MGDMMEYIVIGILGGILGYGLCWLKSRHDVNRAKAIYPPDDALGRHHLKNIVEDLCCLECEKKINAALAANPPARREIAV